jgi:hypothetical protein
MAAPSSVVSSKDRVGDYEIENKGQVEVQGPIGVAQEAIVPHDAAATNLPPEKAVKLDRRAIKNEVSKHCLATLKETVGTLSLAEPSKSLEQFPKAAEQLAKYIKIREGFERGDERFPRDYRDLERRVALLQRIINEPASMQHQDLVAIGADDETVAELLRDDPSSKRKIIQELVCLLLKHPIYRTLKEYEHDPLVHFLNMAAEVIHHHSEGMSVFETYGQTLLPQLDDVECDAAALKTHLEKAIGASSWSNVDTKLGRVFTHLPFHWSRSAATKESNEAGSDKTYNPYKTGNYNGSLGAFHLGDVRIGTSAAPNPSHPDYTIFPATHQLNANIGVLTGTMGPTHLQVVLEGEEDHQGPKDRRQSVVEMEKANANLSVMTLPMDGHANDGTGPFAGVRTSREFADIVERHILGRKGEEIGFRFPALLNDEAIRTAIANFRNSFGALEGTPAWQKLIDRNELCKTLVAGLNSCFILEGIKAQARNPVEVVIDGVRIRSTCNFACKQGIDRGAVQNQMLRMIVDAKRKGNFKFTKKQIKQYCGYTAGRAISVEARRIQKKRYEALTNFLSLLTPSDPSKAAEMTARGAGFLVGHGIPDNLQFIPSNGPIEV